MSAEHLKLTTYFGERDRHRGALLADELLECYGDANLRASVLLRGTEGFGRLQHLRTDRLLTLSEDLPLVAVAVDTRERIEPVLDPVLAMMRKGLVTVERARLVGAEATVPGDLGEAVKLTLYLGRRERVGGVAAHVAVTELLRGIGVATAAVLLGVDGTHRGQRARARFFARNDEVPLMLVAVGSRDQVERALDRLRELLPDPLATLERVQVCKSEGTLLTAPKLLPATDEEGLAIWQKLTVHTSNAADHGGRPPHHAIVGGLREADAAGVTVLQGVWGFRGAEEPHGDRLLQLRRHVPAVTVAVDTPERIARSFEIVAELAGEHGVVTCETVPAFRAIEGGEGGGALRLSRHRA